MRTVFRLKNLESNHLLGGRSTDIEWTPLKDEAREFISQEEAEETQRILKLQSTTKIVQDSVPNTGVEIPLTE